MKLLQWMSLMMHWSWLQVLRWGELQTPQRPAPAGLLLVLVLLDAVSHCCADNPYPLGFKPSSGGFLTPASNRTSSVLIKKIAVGSLAKVE
jgi:hypothetical protein